MTGSTRSRQAAGQRAAAVAEATHSAYLEGLAIAPGSLAVAAEYVRGDIDIDDAGRRIRARCSTTYNRRSVAGPGPSPREGGMACEVVTVSAYLLRTTESRLRSSPRFQ
jgi:hypothetical protein